LDDGLNKEYLPKWLQGAGYNTYYIGKFLNGYGLPNLEKTPGGWNSWGEYLGIMEIVV
jgi:arylsulfatase A-like enzyme